MFFTRNVAWQLLIELNSWAWHILTPTLRAKNEVSFVYVAWVVLCQIHFLQNIQTHRMDTNGQQCIVMKSSVPIYFVNIKHKNNIPINIVDIRNIVHLCFIFDMLFEKKFGKLWGLFPKNEWNILFKCLVSIRDFILVEADMKEKGFIN